MHNDFFALTGNPSCRRVLQFPATLAASGPSIYNRLLLSRHPCYNYHHNDKKAGGRNDDNN